MFSPNCYGPPIIQRYYECYVMSVMSINTILTLYLFINCYGPPTIQRYYECYVMSVMSVNTILNLYLLIFR